MRRATLLLTVFLLPCLVMAQPLDYSINGHGSYNLIALPYGPVAFPGDGSALWTNPAGIGINGSSGLLLLGATSAGGDNISSGFEDDWGWGVNLGSMGFAVEYARSRGMDANRYTWGGSSELTEGWNIGWAYHWYDRMNRQNSWDFGMLIRPTHWMSVGGVVTEIGHPRINNARVSPTYHLGLGFRPFGNTLTLTADATLWQSPVADYADTLDLTLGATWQPVPNLALRGGYALDSETIYAGLSIASAFSTLSNYTGLRNNSVAGQPDAVGATGLRLSTDWAPELNDYIFDKPNVVKYKLKGQIVEEPTPLSFFRDRKLTLFELLQRIERMKDDPSIDGLVIDMQSFSLGGSDRAELRDALQDFRDAGKKIVVYSESYTGLGYYYLASVADHIVLHPAGDVMITGLNSTMPYFKGTLDKLGIEAQIVSVGKYKSAPELVTRKDMSEPARESMTALIETVRDVILRDVAESREVSEDKVDEWINNAMFTADEAVDHGLVDALAFHDELDDEVETVMGADKVRTIPYGMYHARTRPPQEWPNMTSPKIAIVYATGSIVSGESSRNPFGGSSMGSTTIAKAIRQARSDPRVKAIVFRIDSGGGSALASDIILREIQRTVEGTDGEGGIPVIVSMSDVAASGGYYIACLADKIIVPETGITGSIGVFGGKFILKGLYDKVGMNHDGVQYGEHADIWSSTRKWNEEEQELLLNHMEAVYERFTGFVAEGRDMPIDEVKEVAQGRVWSGRDALENGLVDENGGILHAIERAREAAGIEQSREISIKLYPLLDGMDLPNEVRMAVMSSLPESAQKVLKAEAELNRLNTGEPLLICPIQDTDMLDK